MLFTSTLTILFNWFILFDTICLAILSMMAFHFLMKKIIHDLVKKGYYEKVTTK
jgi:hypothetical protein